MKMLILIAFTSLLAGCMSIMEMDQPLAPAMLSWAKSGGNDVEKNLALRECAQQSLQVERSTARDIHDSCMLKKGFTFVPKPGNFANTCHFGTFKNGIACKSYRGEYKAKAE